MLFTVSLFQIKLLRLFIVYRGPETCILEIKIEIIFEK